MPHITATVLLPGIVSYEAVINSLSLVMDRQPRVDYYHVCKAWLTLKPTEELTFPYPEALTSEDARKVRVVFWDEDTVPAVRRGDLVRSDLEMRTYALVDTEGTWHEVSDDTGDFDTPPWTEWFARYDELLDAAAPDSWVLVLDVAR